MADTDRRTRMVHSSVKAPPKKDGAGGLFTWGSVTDETNYDFVGAGTSAKVCTARIVNSEPVVQPVAAQNFQLVGAEFPSLLPGASPSPTALPIAPRITLGAPIVRWGPPPVAKPLILNPQDHVRAGAAGETIPAFDGQHPRNTFAKKAYHGSPIAIVELACPSPSNSRVTFSGMTNPAHLSQFAKKPVSDALSPKQLQSIVGKPQFMPAPRISNHQISRQPQSRPIIQQPQARR